MNKIKILIAAHKASMFPKSDIFEPIHVGKEESVLDLNILGDNTGDNISIKNKYYCELTAIYWAWKNLKDVDFIGLCHYRRYFTPKKSELKVVTKNFLKCLIFPVQSIFNPKRLLGLTYGHHIISEKELDNLAKEVKDGLYKGIESGVQIFRMVDQGWYNRSVEEQAHNIGNYYIEQLKDIIKVDYPGYYNLFIKILASNKMQCGNMFVMKKEIFNEYCDFIFGVLAKHEEINLNGIGTGYKRISGYLAELLTTLFIVAKQPECKVQLMDFVLIKEYH